MIYYINVTSWNLLESFVTESISPHMFYVERSFGNNLSRYLDCNHELSNFLVLSTRETQSDYSIQIDSTLIDENCLIPVKTHSTLFIYSKTIYYRKGLVSFRFAYKDLLDSLVAEAHILLDVKCVDKYRDSFYISNKGHRSVEVSSKLTKMNGLSFDLKEYVEKDNWFNRLKGAVVSYATGELTSSNTEEQLLKTKLVELKNLFAGLNTRIMISGERVNEVDDISMKIQEVKAWFGKLRKINTNLFDVLFQQFNEVVKLAAMRSDVISQFRSSDCSGQVERLKQEKRIIELQIFKIEVDNNIADLRDELQAIKDQERMNGQSIGQKRLYFKKDSIEFERKSWLKNEIARFEETNIEYHRLLEKVGEIDQRIAELSSGNTQYDNVIIGIFNRISDIMNDLIKKAKETENLNDITLQNLQVSHNRNISVLIPEASIAETEYFNIVLSYLISSPTSESISDSLILNLIIETARIFKDQPSAATPEGKMILNSLREFWCYKNHRTSIFTIPDDLPVFQSIMAFYVKPFGYDQMERYILHKQIKQKSYAFMLWGACIGYAALPKTFTNTLYQEGYYCKVVDDFLSITDNDYCTNG